MELWFVHFVRHNPQYPDAFSPSSIPKMNRLNKQQTVAFQHVVSETFIFAFST